MSEKSQPLDVAIPNEAGWPKKILDELCSLISRGTAPVYVESSSVLAVGQRCITTSRFAPEFARPHAEQAMRNVLRPESGDVLLNSTGTGTIGRSVVFDHDGAFIVDGHVTVLRPKPEGADGKWLNAVLRTSWGQRHLERFCYAGSTNQLELSRTPVKASMLPVPSLAEQHAIAQILDTLDIAISETEALIDKLKAVKQGLLHDLLTRGVDANGQLRPPQSKAPQLYKESPLGWIPREWSWGTLGHWLIGKPKNGYSPQEAGAWTGIQMLGLGCLTKEGFFPAQLKPAPAGDKGLERALLNEGDLLISRANTRELVGLVGVYRDVGTPCTYPDLMMRLMPSEETSSEFLQLVLQSSKVRRQIQAAASGTSESMVKISSSIVTCLKVVIPNPDEQGVILCRTKTLDGQLQSELQVLEAQRAIKAGLMDDLLTGRVRVTPLLESIQQAAAPTGA